MANQQHLALLRQGVKVWNKWRIDNFDLMVDLREADFKGADLSNAILWNADLRKANFNEANLSGADLSKANLSEADLRKSDLRNLNFSRANLSGAILIKANLRGSDLYMADLHGAMLVRADLRKVYLSEANLSKANLNDANLYGANLSDANLYGANLIRTNLRMLDLRNLNFSKANLSGSVLVRANLRGANLSEANLSNAILNDANLNTANLTSANLARTQVLATNFTAANLTGACIEDWHTNNATNLNNVICNYVYKQRYQRERCPSNGNFTSDEFSKLFQKTLETIDLIFRNGIDWNAFAYSFKKVEVENQGVQLDVQSIEKKGDSILLVRVAVVADADKAKIHNDFMQGYEFAQKVLEAQYQVRVEDKEQEISRLFYLLNKVNEQLGEVPKILAENPRKVSNYYQQNSQIAGGIVDAEIVQSHQIGGDIYNTDKQDKPD